MANKIFEKLKDTDWETQFSGQWSILSLSYWGPFYSRTPFSENVDRYVHKTFIVWRDGKCTAYQPTKDKKIFSEKIIGQIRKDPGFVTDLCKRLKQCTDRFMELADRMMGKEISINEFQEYQDSIIDYYQVHIQIKVSVDFLPKELLDRYLKQFEEARVYA